MQSPSNNQNEASPKKKFFLNLPNNKVLLQGGLYLGVIVAFLLLTKGSDICIAANDSVCNDSSVTSVVLALGGSAAVLFGLTTLLGVPLLPAAGIGLAVWWLIQSSLS